jgi:serine/threonine-protein kinase
VYSLGVVLYELLVGEVPFRGDNFVVVAMKHVNEPPPHLLEVRTDVPHRVAAAIDRALEKDPRRRFPSMDAFAAELEACLAALETGADDEADTIDRGLPLVRRPTPARKHVSRWAIGISLLSLAAIAAVIVGLVALRGHRHQGPVPVSTRIHLRGIKGYDPYGSDYEHDTKALYATDRNRSTYWDTVHYSSFDKPGVGLLLDAGKGVKPSGVTVVTATPGFTARILAGDNESGADFHPVSPTQTITGETTFPLDLHAPRRYFVLWITKLPPGVESVQINEIRAG